ncbi:hypothetical protein [Streptomyces aureus]|uniref:hypothetical protein n=1 Tax=Streptomyces aureus TaxID=193461 RepID=UPI0034081457
MTLLLGSRVMAAMVPVCVVGTGACFGFVVDGWVGAVVGTAAAGLGMGFGMTVRPRPGKEDGYREGKADAVLLTVGLYEAAVFPFAPGGVSDEERAARRTAAYCSAASEGLPHSVQVAAAAVLETLDDDVDADRAQAAFKDLIVAVYDSRGQHGLSGSSTADGGRGGLAGVVRRLRRRSGPARKRRRSFPAS